MGRTSNNRSFKKKNFYKLQDGDMVFRILPPLKELAKLTDLGDLANADDNTKNSWSKFHAIHFGYKNTEGKARPFESPLVEDYNQETKVRTVKTPDAALNRLNDLKDKLAKAKEEGNGPLETKLNTLVGFMGVYSLDKNHHMNVVDLQGNIGTLKIRHKAKLALDQEIERLESEGVDPLSVDNGRFLRFSRSGKGNETGFKVVEYMEKVDGGYREVVSKLTNDILSRIKTEASDLGRVAAKLTAEEVAKVVATSDLLTGKSSAINEYIDARRKAQRESNSGNQGDDGQDDGPDAPNSSRNVGNATSNAASAATSAQSTAGIVNQNSTQTPTVSAPSLGVTATSGSTFSPGSTLTNTLTPAASTVTVTPKISSPIDELSDADFFKQIGVETP